MQPSLALTLVRRSRFSDSLTTNLVLVLAGSLFLAAMAQIAIPIAFSPVPLTMQTFAVVLVGAALGSKRGAAAVGCYLTQGCAGLPFFAQGKAGLLVLYGPTGGYLIGFVLAAWLIGFLAERGLDRRFWTALCVFAVGELVILSAGTLWLSLVAGQEAALAAGFVPFVPGAGIKAALAAALLPTAWSLAGRAPKR